MPSNIYFCNTADFFFDTLLIFDQRIFKKIKQYFFDFRFNDYFYDHNLQVTEEKLCPNSACASCACAALAAQEFRLSVRNSHKMWLRTLNCISEIPTSGTSCKSICAFFNVEEMTMQALKDYIGGEPKTVLDRLQKSKTRRKPRSDRSGPACQCPDCGKLFITPYFLNMHLINSGQKEACLLCGEVVLRGEGMRDHMVSVHKESALLCKQCPFVCKDQNELQTHVAKAHKTHALTCSDCGRIFSRRKTFEFHYQMHAVRTCRACGSQFTNRGCYRVHRSNCEPDAMPDLKKIPQNRRSNIRDPATFKCADCGKTYSSKPQLKNHINWIHMNIRPHQCKWCEKRFYTPSRLAEHTVVHTRARNFECDICGVKLVSKMAAVYHRRRHTGEKPYQCPDCGDSFISASRRSEHAKRRHNKGVKIQCQYCPSTFVRKHELKKHVLKAHVVEIDIGNSILVQQ